MPGSKPKKVVAEKEAPRRTVLTIKGTDEWRDWLTGLSKALRMPTSTIVDHALIKYARDQGYTVEAPER